MVISFTGKEDLFILIAVALVWLFVSVNLNTILGLTYVAMAFFYWNMRQSGKVYPIFKGKTKWAKIIIPAILFVFAWVYLASGIVGSLAPGLDKETTLRVFSITEEALHPYMMLFLIGFMVPIVEESMFRSGIVSYLSDRMHGNVLLVGLVSAAIFSVWHLTVYSMANTAMISAFIFGMIAYFITIKTGSLLQAIVLHVALNVYVMASSLGLI